MSRAVLSKETKTPIEQPRPPRRGVMPGAEGPDTPNDQRKIENVLRDFAIAAWGRIRDAKISLLDSAKAETILADEMGKLLSSLRDDGPKLRKDIANLRMVGSKLARSLRAHVSRYPQPHETANGQDNRRRCRECNQPVTAHGASCKVVALLRMATEAGMTAPDDDQP